MDMEFFRYTDERRKTEFKPKFLMHNLKWDICYYINLQRIWLWCSGHLTFRYHASYI